MDHRYHRAFERVESSVSERRKKNDVAEKRDEEDVYFIVLRIRGCDVPPVDSTEVHL